MLVLTHQGADMRIWVRGNRDSDSTLLVVHGGAGSTSANHIEDFQGELETRYRVAYWDQRHAGSSSGSFSRRTFNTDTAVSLMAEDMKFVVDMLHQRYGPSEKVFALGHSWGVQLGTRYLIEHGSVDIDGWIASNGSHSSPSEYAARNRFIERYAAEMVESGVGFIDKPSAAQSPEDASTWVTSNTLINTWEQIIEQTSLGTAIYESYVAGQYTAEDFPPSFRFSERYLSGPYSLLAERINALRTGQLINWRERRRSVQEFYDYTDEMSAITLPIALLWGTRDWIIGPAVAEDYAMAVGTAPKQITMELFEQSGHMPMYEQNADYVAMVIEFMESVR